MGDLRDAFNASVDASGLTPADAALAEAGRTIAGQIDDAVLNGSGQEVTKALYLTPHLVNILKEMLATPAARKSAGLSDKEAGGGKLAQLRSVQANGKQQPKSARRRAS